VAIDPLLNKPFDTRYLILRKLGAGGMADVYLAEDRELGRRVALKLLNDRHAGDEQFVERFRREAQSAASLNHPNIVAIFDRRQAEGTYYIAMEFLDGRTLKELLIKNGPTPITIAIDYARQILSALSFAHRHGIVHRDIKPHNIVVNPDGRLKVTDFGIARSGASQMTEAGSIVGTAQYLSPEQARGAPVDPRSDLYSLGIVMYEMLTGKVPFTGDAPVEIAMKHLSAVPDPPSSSRDEVGPDLDAVVMRALAKDPDHRYGSAEEMDADLARVARGLAVSQKTTEAMTQVLAGAGATAVSSAQTMVVRPRVVTPPPAPPVYRPPSGYYEYEEPPRRRSLWPWLLGLLALVIAGGAGYLLYDRIQDQLDKNEPVAVADVGLLREDLARQKLESQGFEVRVFKMPSQNVAAGQVVRQDPVAGDKRPKESPVRIWVSSGIPKTTVPDLVNRTLSDAIALIYAAKLTPKTHDVHSNEPAQTITAQKPKPGETVPTGSPVHVNVSQGPKQASVPSVVGQLYPNARSALQGQSFRVERQFVDDSAPKGQVVAQDPPAGSLVVQRTVVTLSVSKGPQTSNVPAVTGRTRAEAEQLVEAAGFASTVFEQDVSDPSQDGLVLSQDPGPNKKLEQGSAVTLVVGRLVSAPPPETTTTTTPTEPTDTVPTTEPTTTAPTP
jgi:eukaryotic-like serine/threonine-protein kinase